MDKALRIYSWKGFFVEEVAACSITSRGAARNIGPFVAQNKKSLVTWVRPTWEKGRLKRRSHFRTLPGSHFTGSVLKQLEDDINQEKIKKRSSTIHNLCRDTLAAALRKRIGTNLDWHLVGKELSDFNFSGDFLRGVETIETEYPIKTPFETEYRLDIALLGPVIGNKRIVLGAVELELHHEFEHLKCLLCKCLGFPLVSIDISEFTAANATEDTLIRALLETTTTSDDGRRRNFFYLHPCLLPVFLDIPASILNESVHQFVIFTKNERYPRLFDYLKKLRDKLKLDPNEYNIAQVKSVGPTGATMISNEGGIAGHDWQDYSSERYIRVSLPRPSTQNIENYFFHLVLAQLVNAHEPSLVGYKYEKRISNTDSEGPIWIKKKFKDGAWSEHRICPKHLSDPIESILGAIEGIGT